MQRFANEEEVDTSPSMTPEQFVDLTRFYIALGAYMSLEEFSSDLSSLALKPNMSGRFIKGYTEVGIPKYLLPYVSEHFPRLKPALQTASSGRGAEKVRKLGKTLIEVCSLIKSKFNEFDESLSGSDRAIRAMRSVVHGVSDNYAVTIGKMAEINSISTNRVLSQWIMRAADSLNVAPSQQQLLMMSAEEGAQLGDRLAATKSLLTRMSPDDPAREGLQEQVSDLQSGIDTAVESSPDPSATAAVVAMAAVPRTYATKIGAKIGLSASQEAAVLQKGKTVIGAGAGSGKTSTLAALCVHRVLEEGQEVSNILATSFSRKSAAELRERIEKMLGRKIQDSELGGFGTTHSIAARLVRDYGGRAGKDYLKDYEPNIIVKLAMKQVSMLARPAIPPPAMTSLFAAPVQTEDGLGQGNQKPLTLSDAFELAKRRGSKLPGFHQQFLYGLWDRSNRFYGVTMRNTKGLVDIDGFTPKQREIVDQIFRQTGVSYSKNNDPNFVRNKAAGFDDTQAKLERGLRDKYKYYSAPANQWFNLGLPTERVEKGVVVPIPVGDFARAITKFKGKAISPSEAWSKDQSVFSAVYAAYEWLKSGDGEPQFAGKADRDDGLLDTAKFLVQNPDVLKKVQNRFKTVLVDEAQDLNRAQHLLFGLIAGYIDPKKADKIGTAEQISELAHSNGSITAETYALIGDDKQSIYAFRSADPDVFIGMSNLVEGGAGFVTQILATNYRSGENIVKAAGSLIRHNNKQIPMVCEANPKRQDKGAVTAVELPPVAIGDTSTGAIWFSQTVSQLKEEGSVTSWDSVGLGVRSNAEAYAYGLELLKKGIPFRTKANFFKDKNTQALLHWLTIAEQGENGNKDLVNEAVLGAIKAPVSRLGETFVDRLQRQASGNYLTWLVQNYRSIYGPQASHTEAVATYVENLLHISSMQGKDASSVYNAILSLQGYDGISIEKSLINNVMEDADAMAEIVGESEDGRASLDAVKERAYAPLAPIQGLLDSRANLQEAMSFIRRLQSANAKYAKEDDPDEKSKEPAITIGTAHSWKGLEVPHMFVPVMGGSFPREGCSDSELAEERRLMYVAMTRAQDHLWMVHIPTIRETKAGAVIRKSQFMSEMCVPVESGTFNLEDPDEDSTGEMGKFASDKWSALDDAVIDAYLNGAPF